MIVAPLEIRNYNSKGNYFGIFGSIKTEFFDKFTLSTSLKKN